MSIAMCFRFALVLREYCQFEIKRQKTSFQFYKKSYFWDKSGYKRIKPLIV